MTMTLIVISIVLLLISVFCRWAYLIRSSKKNCFDERCNGYFVCRVATLVSALVFAICGAVFMLFNMI